MISGVRTAAHVPLASICCGFVVHKADMSALCGQTIGPTVQPADIPPPQSATLGLFPAARKLLSICRPAEGRRLS